MTVRQRKDKNSNMQQSFGARMGKSKRYHPIIVLSLLLVLTGCSSVTMRPYGGEKTTEEPDYAESRPYYWGGLKGEHTIDTKEICKEHRVMQMQSVTTLSDFIRGIFTLFIYSPRTAKIWCER